jgi:hypothetical protein
MDSNSLKRSACRRSGHIKRVSIQSLLDVKLKVDTTKLEFTNYARDKEYLEHYGVTWITRPSSAFCISEH